LESLQIRMDQRMLVHSLSCFEFLFTLIVFPGLLSLGCSRCVDLHFVGDFGLGLKFKATAPISEIGQKTHLHLVSNSHYTGLEIGIVESIFSNGFLFLAL